MEKSVQTDIDVKDIMKKLLTDPGQDKMGAMGKNDMNPELTLDDKVLSLNRIIHVKNSSYAIHSHRKIIGPIMVYIRGLINSETRRYIDPLLNQQNCVNMLMLEIIDQLVHENAELQMSLEEQKRNHED